VAALSSGGRSFAVAAHRPPGGCIWSDAGPPEVTRQAGG